MLKEIKKQLNRKTVVQETMGAVLELSTQNLSLEEQMGRILDQLLAIPWLSLEAKGCIFLADKGERRLEMVAQRGLPPELQKACANVPFGHCLCGRAASTARMVFCNRLDESHETIYEGMPEHGHYCLPVLSGKRILGVVNLYVRPGHVRDQLEEDFFQAISHILSGMIERRRAEESLAQAQNELEIVARQQTAKGAFNQVVVREVETSWRQGMEEDGWPPPPPAHIAQILEAVFLASLQKREEQPTQISVSLVAEPIQMEALTEVNGFQTRFSFPFPFTPDTLATLAPAFDPVTTSLIISPVAPESDRLEIVGAAYFSHEGLHRFNAQNVSLTSLDIFSVIARKAGHLVIYRGDRTLGRFMSGQFSVPNPIPFTESPMAWNLLRSVQNHPEYKTHEMIYWEVYKDLLDRLLLEATRRGKGGILLWSPGATVKSLPDQLIHKRFPMEEAPELAGLLGQFARHEIEVAAGGDNASRVMARGKLSQYRRRIIEMVEMLAQLSCTDGALVLSDRFQPLSFGSMLTAPPWTGQVVSWTEEQFFPSLRIDVSKLGARHNSALNFVGRQPGTVAFVISQDGPVAGLVRKDENAIYWWPDCLSGLSETL